LSLVRFKRKRQFAGRARGPGGSGNEQQGEEGELFHQDLSIWHNSANTVFFSRPSKYYQGYNDNQSDAMSSDKTTKLISAGSFVLLLLLAVVIPGVFMGCLGALLLVASYAWSPRSYTI